MYSIHHYFSSQSLLGKLLQLMLFLEAEMGMGKYNAGGGEPSEGLPSHPGGLEILTSHFLTLLATETGTMGHWARVQT